MNPRTVSKGAVLLILIEKRRDPAANTRIEVSKNFNIFLVSRKSSS